MRRKNQSDLPGEEEIPQQEGGQANRKIHHEHSKQKADRIPLPRMSGLAPQQSKVTWVYCVTYRSPSGLRDKKFRSREKAQALVDRIKRKGGKYDFYRFRGERWYERMLRADVYWMGWRMRLFPLIGALALLSAAFYEWSLFQ